MRKQPKKRGNECSEKQVKKNKKQRINSGGASEATGRRNYRIKKKKTTSEQEWRGSAGVCGTVPAQ